LTASIDDVWTTKIEVGHPDDLEDATDTDTVTEVNWPI